MKALGTDDPARLRAAGVIDLPTIQRYLNFHYRSRSTSSAPTSRRTLRRTTARAQGRFEEGKRADDHRLHDPTYPVLEVAAASSSEAGANAQCAERGAAR